MQTDNQSEDRQEVKTINIEICTNCSQHQTHTRHNEQTYLKFFIECKAAIESQLPGIIVEKNANIKPGYKPQLGAFEISCNGIPIYSKIKTGLWPQPNLVSARVYNFVEDYKEGKSVKHFVEIKEKKIQEEKRVITPNTVYGNFYSPMQSNDSKNQKQQQQDFQQQFLEQQQQQYYEAQPEPKQKQEPQQINNYNQPEKKEQPNQNIEEPKQNIEKLKQDKKPQQEQPVQQQQEEEQLPQKQEIPIEENKPKEEDKPKDEEQSKEEEQSKDGSVLQEKPVENEKQEFQEQQ